jgi:hypothetical protein
MGRDTDIAHRLRDAGLRVVEVDGWTSRGSSEFGPRGAVTHHTAGPRDGNIPSLNTLIYGRSDLPGPLCNVAQARNNDVYVIASGRANHAGDGGWRGLSGNSSVYGLEIENVGTGAEPWRQDQVDTSARIQAALIRGKAGADMVCQHKEWTSRKIDAVDADGDTFRGRVDYFLRHPHPKPKPPTFAARSGDDPMFIRSEGFGLFLIAPGGKVASMSAPDWEAARASAPAIPTVTLPKAAAEALVY